MAEAHPISTHWRFKDLTGKTFGRLTVLEYAGQDKFRLSLWRCLCDCGKFMEIRGSALTQKTTKSCGCFGAYMAAKAHTTHGECESPEYIIWQGMKQRCSNRNHDAYKYYGGRGITVCDRWLTSFENFLADMGRRPSKKHSIDRHPDNNGNYCPENCRWATKREQGSNKRTNVFLTLGEETKTLAEWQERLGASHRTIPGRIKAGWSVHDTLTTPVRGRE